MDESALSFKFKTLFEQLRLESKNPSGEINLTLSQQEIFIKGIKELEDYSQYLFEKCVELDNLGNGLTEGEALG